YGEHPDSTRQKRIYYHFVRGFDLPIPILRWQDIKATIEKFATDHNLTTKTKTSNPSPPSNVRTTPSTSSVSIRRLNPDRSGLHVEDFLMPVKEKRMGNHIQGAHPIHGSTTGNNLSIDTVNNVWHCFRCGSGGGAIEAAAVAARIIDCSEATPGWQTP